MHFLKKKNYLFIQVKINKCGHQEKLNLCGFIVKFQHCDDLATLIQFCLLVKINKPGIKIKFTSVVFIYLFTLNYIILLLLQVKHLVMNSLLRCILPIWHRQSTFIPLYITFTGILEKNGLSQEHTESFLSSNHT